MEVRNISEEAKWYVVHTYSGYENKVKSNIEKVVENRNLQDLIPEVMIPMEEVTEVKGNKIDKGDRKLFPSYVLVKMVLTDDSWYIVRNTRGVTGFVGPASKPVPLTDKEVAALGVDTQRSANVQVGFKEGDNVVVTQAHSRASQELWRNSIWKHRRRRQSIYAGQRTTVTMPLTQIKSEDKEKGGKTPQTFVKMEAKPSMTVRIYGFRKRGRAYGARLTT